jgi:hypothetical protein
MRTMLLVVMLAALAIGGVSQLRTGIVLAQGGNEYCCECIDGSNATVHADSFPKASEACSVACAGNGGIRKVAAGKCP